MRRREVAEALEQAALAELRERRAELARIGGRAPSRGELTEAERRIAELVSHGKTNREIAEALYISPKTVEANLTRIYRKLQVGSRTELVRSFLDVST